MGIILELFEIIGLFVRWVFEDRFCFSWKKFKELNSEQSNKNLLYGILSCAIIVIVILIFQFL